ncbi:TonB-dependent receptor [Spirosoma pulveris]
MEQLRAVNFNVLLAEKQLDLNEVVVAANRTTELLSRVAQPIRIFTRNELRFLNQPTMAEVLQQSGQVLVQKSQLGGGSPILRGFEANKVLMVVDGVRMNNAIFRGGHLQNILTIDNAAVERMEVALGPGSVVYGSDALGGVIFVQTLSPKLSASDKMSVNANGFVRYGSAMNEKTAHADWNIGFRKWALTTSVTGSDFGDLRQGKQRNTDMGQLGLRPFYAGFENNTDVKVTNPDPLVQVASGYKQIDLLQKVLFQPNERTQHLLNAQFSTSSDIPRYDRLTEVDAKGNPVHAQWYYGPQKRLLTAYGLTKQFTTGLADELKLVAAYQSIEESRHNRRFGNYGLQHQTEKVNVWTLNADLKKKLTAAHTLRYGMEGTFNTVQSTAYRQNVQTGKIDPLDTRYPDGGANTQSLAGYLSGTLDVSSRSTLTYGARYAYNRLYAKFNDKTFFPFPFNDITQQSGAVTGSLGWVTRLPDNWQLATSLSSGYRVPNVDDLAKVFESVAGNLIIPNPNLKPERTYTFDAGVRKQIAERVSLDLEGFYTLYTNAINTQPGTLNGQSQIDYNGRISRIVTQVNSQQARLFGFNAQLSADLTQSLTLFGTVTYTKGRIRTDSTGYPLDHIPPLYGKGGLRMTIKQFRAEANVLFNGWKRLKDYNLVGEDNIVYATPQGMPAWQTINLRTSYQVNRYLQVQASLENILDRNYRVFASGISAPGRNLLLTLRGTL